MGPEEPATADAPVGAVADRPMPEFDLDRPWALAPAVAVRREPFGALAYNFDTRRLSFLGSRPLLDAVEHLSDHPTGRAACQAAGVPAAELPRYGRALATLAETGMIVERPR